MKLVKITEPKEGTVYETINGFSVLCKTEEDQCDCKVFSKDKIYLGETAFDDIDEMKNTLIGKLGITHSIKNGKLVEIPRKDIEVDDVFEFKKWTEICVVSSIVHFTDHKTAKTGLEYTVLNKDGTLFNGRSFSHFDENIDYVFKKHFDKKTGILGIHYEFVNSKE